MKEGKECKVYRARLMKADDVLGKKTNKQTQPDFWA